MRLKKVWETSSEEGREFRGLKDHWDSHDSGVLQWDQIVTIGFATSTRTISASTAIDETYQVVLVDSTAAVRTVTLPSAVVYTGRRFTIKDWKGQSAANAITVATVSAQTIDGAATKVLNVAYVSYTVVSDGANWAII